MEDKENDGAPPRRYYTLRDVLESPELAAYLRQAQIGTPGNEADPTVRYYGHIGEGYTVQHDSSPEYRELMQIRYIRRRILMSYHALPEGYELQHEFPGRQTRPVVLLTPPALLAVQNNDGTWFRQERGMPAPGGARAQDRGPAPYTEEWYQDYLRANNLPAWFLRLQHMSEHLADDEAITLWLNDRGNMPDFSTMGLTLPTEYLNSRYPEEQQIPTPAMIRAGTTYVYDLLPAEIARVARYFPAVVANAHLGNFRIFFRPGAGSHIIVRHLEGLDEAPIQEGDQLIESGTLEWAPNKRDRLIPHRASYLSQYEDTLQRTTGRAATVTITREERVRSVGDAGGYIDVNPKGLGEWRFLDPVVDQRLANELGFNTFKDVVLAQQNGSLVHGMGPNGGPVVVFYPAEHFLNPFFQPAGPGRWQYFTDGDRELAWINFGDQTGFEGNPRPTADNIWNRRQHYVATGEEDLTQDVDLVWVPGEEVSDEEMEEDGDDQTEPPPGGDRDNSMAGINATVQDPVSGLFHDPLNRGENNQTGRVGEAWYQTAFINGRQFTVDRSRAHANDIEVHKSWFVDTQGRWRQFRDYRTLDWTNKARVEAMNKWREQSFARTKLWPLKRGARRVDYTQEEKEWLFEYVKEAKGDKALVGQKELGRLFNEHFVQNRGESGVIAVYDRLRDQYHRNGGTMDPHIQRGAYPRKKKRVAAGVDVAEDPKDGDYEEEDEEMDEGDD